MSGPDCLQMGWRVGLYRAALSLRLVPRRGVREVWTSCAAGDDAGDDVVEGKETSHDGSGSAQMDSPGSAAT